VIWLLLGVPHRAFKYKLDLNGEGNAQRVLVRALVIFAAVLTGVYILLLHFGSGPLEGVSIRALISGIIFTVFLVVPAYRSVAKVCWQRGIGSLFSPKPLAKGWIAALTELNIAFHEAAVRFQDRRRLEKASGQGKDAAQRSTSEQRRGNGSHTQPGGAGSPPARQAPASGPPMSRQQRRAAARRDQGN
jgi:hypothetical protein